MKNNNKVCSGHLDIKKLLEEKNIIANKNEKPKNHQLSFKF